MKKILFATDFSTNANKAFCFALNIAEKHQAELIMVHVFDIPPVWNYPVSYNPSEMKRQTLSSWERTLKEFFEHYDTDVKAKFVAVEHPSVVRGIISAIKQYKPDLVVTGTRGKSALKDAILGGTTKALVNVHQFLLWPFLNMLINMDMIRFYMLLIFAKLILTPLSSWLNLLNPINLKFKYYT